MFYVRLLYRMYKKGFARGFDAGFTAGERKREADWVYGLRKDWK